MTEARDIAAEETEPEPIPLWMLPIILIQIMIRALFAHDVDNMKRTARTHRPPEDWRGHYPALQLSEWAMESMRGQGAGILLAGKPLDIWKLDWPGAPPEWFRPDLPRTVYIMHRRFTDLMRFHSDPERYIRRHAARILKRMRQASGHCVAPAGAFAPRFGPPDQIAPSAPSLTPFRHAAKRPRATSPAFQAVEDVPFHA